MATSIYRRNAITAGLKEMAEKGDRGARRALAALAVDDPELKKWIDERYPGNGDDDSEEKETARIASTMAPEFRCQIYAVDRAHRLQFATTLRAHLADVSRSTADSYDHAFARLSPREKELIRGSQPNPISGPTRAVVRGNTLVMPSHEMTREDISSRLAELDEELAAMGSK